MTELTLIQEAQLKTQELQARVDAEAIARPAVLEQLEQDNANNIVRKDMLIRGSEWSDELAIAEQARLKAEMIQNAQEKARIKAEKEEEDRLYIQSLAPTSVETTTIVDVVVDESKVERLAKIEQAKLVAKQKEEQARQEQEAKASVLIAQYKASKQAE